MPITPTKPNKPFVGGQQAIYSGGVGTIGSPFPGSGYDENLRRTYERASKIAKLGINEMPFLSFSQLLRREETTDPRFMSHEERDQWHRRRGTVQEAVSRAVAVSASGTSLNNVKLTTNVDKFGFVNTNDNRPLFILEGQILDIELDIDKNTGKSDYSGLRYSAKTKVNAKVRVQSITNRNTTNDAFIRANLAVLSIDDINIDEKDPSDAFYFGTFDKSGTPTANYQITIPKGRRYFVAGTSWAEGTGGPDGWVDEITDRVGYCQIFKSGIPLLTGSMMSTEYMLDPDQFTRTLRNNIMSHKHDINRAFLFGVGRYSESFSGNTSSDPVRETWGIIPYVKRFGVTQTFDATSTTVDNLSNFMNDFVNPSKGMMPENVVVHCSRKVSSWLRYCSTANSFRNNTIGDMTGARQYVPPSSTPYAGASALVQASNMTAVDTAWGRMNFVVEEELRDAYEDTAFICTLGNVAYRPLAGNGRPRDYVYRSNVQANDIDARRDQIISECGLQVNHADTHAVLTFEGIPGGFGG